MLSVSVTAVLVSAYSPRRSARMTAARRCSP